MVSLDAEFFKPEHFPYCLAFMFQHKTTGKLESHVEHPVGSS